MAQLKGYKSPLTSVGVMGPAAGFSGFIITQLVAFFQSVPPNQWAVWGTAAFTAISGIYGRWRATKLVAAIPMSAKIVPALLVVAMLVLAPPLAYAQDGGALVAEAPAAVTEKPVPAAGEAIDVVPPTENQTVAIEWGNWISVLLNPIRDAALTIIPLIAIWILSQLPAAVRLFIPARRVNDMLAHAINGGFNSIETKVRGKVYTAKIMNEWLRSSAAYAIAQAPQMVNEVAATLPLLLQKLIARIPSEMVPPGYTLEEALKGVTPASVKAKAKAQDLPPDPFNTYFGK